MRGGGAGCRHDRSVVVAVLAVYYRLLLAIIAIAVSVVFKITANFLPTKQLLGYLVSSENARRARPLNRKKEKLREIARRERTSWRGNDGRTLTMLSMY